MDGSDALIEFGATIPLAVAEGAPQEMQMAWPPLANAVVRMPKEVAAATGVDHLTVYWEPHGHPAGGLSHAPFRLPLLQHLERHASSDRLH
jgi:hypothetical protein